MTYNEFKNVVDTFESAKAKAIVQIGGTGL